MARMSAPPKNNIYTLMLIVATTVFVFGLVMNHIKLSKYNNITAAVPRKVNVEEMWSSSEVAETGDAEGGDLDKLLGIEEE